MRTCPVKHNDPPWSKSHVHAPGITQILPQRIGKPELFPRKARDACIKPRPTYVLTVRTRIINNTDTGRKQAPLPPPNRFVIIDMKLYSRPNCHRPIAPTLNPKPV